MRQHTSYRPSRPQLVAKAARADRSGEAAIVAASLLLITGFLIGQLLLLISP